VTGREHYEHAELLLEMAGDDDSGSDAESYHLTSASVHALLAINRTLLEVADAVTQVPGGINVGIPR